MQARELYCSGPYVSPDNDLERALVTQWQRALLVDQVGVDDDFFELGGDSMVAMQIATWVRRRFGVTLTQSTPFTNPTVRALSQVIEEALVQRARQS